MFGAVFTLFERWGIEEPTHHHLQVIREGAKVIGQQRLILMPHALFHGLQRKYELVLSPNAMLQELEKDSSWAEYVDLESVTDLPPSQVNHQALEQLREQHQGEKGEMPMELEPLRALNESEEMLG